MDSGAVALPVVLPGTEFEIGPNTFIVDPKTGRSRQALLKGIAAWLSSEFGLPALDEPPTIAFASTRRMAGLRYAPSERLDDRAAEVVAIYDDKAKTIYLPDGWTGRTAADLSVLVHELVHHLQNVGGQRFECPEAREKVAYAAQQRWLGLFGSDLLTDFELDPFTILLRTKCLH